jgi:hypothetical protein
MPSVAAGMLSFNVVGSTLGIDQSGWRKNAACTRGALVTAAGTGPAPTPGVSFSARVCEPLAAASLDGVVVAVSVGVGCGAASL